MLLDEKNELLQKVGKSEPATSQQKAVTERPQSSWVMSGQCFDRKKRHRRTAGEIERHYRCPNCLKSYGSEGSLSQHIKLKHRGLNLDSARQQTNMNAHMANINAGQNALQSTIRNVPISTATQAAAVAPAVVPAPAPQTPCKKRIY